MIVQEILDSVKRTFGDESGVQITNTDIIRWINQGQRQIVMQNESLFQETATTDAVANTQNYTLPVDLLILKGIQYRESGETQYFKLQGWDLAKFNELVDGWDGSTDTPGVPVMYTVYNGEIITYPVPSEAATAAFKIYYNRTPVDIVDTTDTPELPIIYHELLIKHCLHQAYELDENWEGAGNKVSELDRDINLLRGREDWKTQETYPTITTLWEDMY